jgi:predicted RNase H-like HicB family nuclease
MGYPAVFYRQQDGVGVVFPDLPGCVTVGRDVKDAVLKAEEALGGHLALMEKDGEVLPAPTMPVDAAEVDEECRADLIGKVWIQPQIGHVVRVTITIDDLLLARVDQAAGRNGESRSGFLAEGARRRLGSP